MWEQLIPCWSVFNHRHPLGFLLKGMILVCLVFLCYYGLSVPVLVFVVLLCTSQLCDTLSGTGWPQACRVEGKLYRQWSGCEFCSTLSLTVGPTSSVGLSKALCYCCSWKYLQCDGILSMLQPNSSPILRLYPNLEEVCIYVWHDFLEVFLCLTINSFWHFIGQLYKVLGSFFKS